ncbi:MAG TPA: DUF3352 domain-containing protein [Vicinamibacterales bacterium]|nr:DUF3352 domain-containing protein [Vicinamibacterales bacterium]
MSNKTRYFVAISGAILAIGLGTGLVASYMGLPVSVFSSAAGPEELQYVPADAAVVAYANVRDVMNSELRKRFKAVEPSTEQKNEFEEKTGLNFEEHVDSVVAAVMPKDGMANHPAGAFLILARTQYNAEKLQNLAIEHGAEVTQYQGKTLITHQDKDTNDPTPDNMAFGFVEADLVAFGTIEAVKASIDARASNRNIVSNNEMMKLVNEINNANAWAVGRFDAIADKAGLPTEVRNAMPAISWFSAAGHINGGVSGTFKAEAKDEATAKNLRDVMGGFLAMAKMQAQNKPGMQQLADSLVISGEGNSVALAFDIPAEVLDVLEGLAKSRRGVQQQ